MFWRMTGLSSASPVDTIMDKGSFTLEELLDEDEIIQECKALNSRLINFGSLFTNSNWFAFEEEKAVDEQEQSTGAAASPSPNTEEIAGGHEGNDDHCVERNDDLSGDATSEVPETTPRSNDTTIDNLADGSRTGDSDEPPEWVERRDSVEPSVTVIESAATNDLPNGELESKPETGNGDNREADSLSPVNQRQRMEAAQCEK